MTGLIHLQTQGATASIHPTGAHVTSWTPADGRQRLFLSAATEMGEGKAIRGGVPVVFPQFSDDGPYPRHGLVRNRTWTLRTHSPDRAVFSLSDSEATRALWPHPFQLQFEVALGPAQLAMTLRVENPGPAPFTFAAALHTYLRIEDLPATRVEGLSGHTYRDNNDPTHLHTDPDPAITFPGEIDRAYFAAPTLLTLRDGPRSLTVHAAGFPDAVVWNPGPEKAAALKDLEPGGHHRFVCIESAAIQPRIELNPGQTWTATQTLS